MKAIIGRKIGMSQMFTEDGQVVPVTLVVAQPNEVLIRRNTERDGYAAVQLGLPSSSSVKSKAFKRRPYAVKAELAVEVADDQSQVTVEQFTIGDTVQVIGTSKGKGFQGVVKRHHFKGGPASHGHRHVLRRPGSIGAQYPQHVLKGMRMAGRMGHDRVTVKNLQVMHVDVDKHLLAIKGAIPGRRNSVVQVMTTEVAGTDEAK